MSDLSIGSTPPPYEPRSPDVDDEPTPEPEEGAQPSAKSSSFASAWQNDSFEAPPAGAAAQVQAPARPVTESHTVPIAASGDHATSAAGTAAVQRQIDAYVRGLTPPSPQHVATPTVTADQRAMNSQVNRHMTGWHYIPIGFGASIPGMLYDGIAGATYDVRGGNLPISVRWDLRR